MGHGSVAERCRREVEGRLAQRSVQVASQWHRNGEDHKRHPHDRGTTGLRALEGRVKHREGLRFLSSFQCRGLGGGLCQESQQAGVKENEEGVGLSGWGSVARALLSEPGALGKRSSKG